MPDGTNGRSRRKVLQTSATLAASGLVAGCSNDGTSGTEPAESDTPTSDSSEDADDSGSSASFPSEPVTFVVPYGTAGGYNYYTRLVAKYINDEGYLPTEARVKNIEGAGGIVATNQVYSAEPNGYTLEILNTEAFALSQLVRDEAKFDLSEMTYFPRVAGRVGAIGVSTKTDIKTGDEFIKQFSSNKIKIGNQGKSGTVAFMVIALGEVGGVFSSDTYKQNSVVFDDRGAEFTALKRGETQAMSGSLSSLLPYVESGDLRIVLTYTQKDSPPETVQNSGCDTLKTLDTNLNKPKEIIALAGGPYHRIFAGPPDIPTERADILREAITKAIKNSDLQKEAKEADRPIRYGDSETSREGALTTLEAYKNNKSLLKESGLM